MPYGYSKNFRNQYCSCWDFSFATLRRNDTL